MVIEAIHRDRAGNLQDLIDVNTGNVVFPFSKGIIMQFYIDIEEKISQTDIEVEEINSDAIKSFSFFKLNDYFIINARVPENTLKMLYTLKTVSDKKIIIDNKEYPFTDIIITENNKSVGVVGVTMQLLINEISITGNY